MKCEATKIFFTCKGNNFNEIQETKLDMGSSKQQRLKDDNFEKLKEKNYFFQNF